MSSSNFVVDQVDTNAQANFSLAGIFRIINFVIGEPRVDFLQEIKSAFLQVILKSRHLIYGDGNIVRKAFKLRRSLALIIKVVLKSGSVVMQCDTHLAHHFRVEIRVYKVALQYSHITVIQFL